MGEEPKYSLGLAAMDRESLEGAAKAAQGMADRKFQDFEADIEIIIEGGLYDEDQVQQLKELKMGIGMLSRNMRKSFQGWKPYIP